MASQSFGNAAVSAAGSTNRILAFPGNVTVGDPLVAAVAFQSVSGQPAITDTQGNTWAEIGQVDAFLNGVKLSLILFWTTALASGANTVTASVSGITTPSNVWLAIGEAMGVSGLAIISGSTLGYGMSPDYVGKQSSQVQATNPPLTTPTGALLILAAATQAGTATWSIDPANNWYTIAVQAGGIVLAFALNLYVNAPFCDMNAPQPLLDKAGDSSIQWVALTAPFTTTVAPPLADPSTDTPITQNLQYPKYPFGGNEKL